jgi:hypothetical protein
MDEQARDRSSSGRTGHDGVARDGTTSRISANGKMGRQGRQSGANRGPNRDSVGAGVGAVLPVVAVLAAFGLAGLAIVAGMDAVGAAALVAAAATAATQVLQQVRTGRRDRPEDRPAVDASSDSTADDLDAGPDDTPEGRTGPVPGVGR